MPWDKSYQKHHKDSLILLSCLWQKFLHTFLYWNSRLSLFPISNSVWTTRHTFLLLSCIWIIHGLTYNHHANCLNISFHFDSSTFHSLTLLHRWPLLHIAHYSWRWRYPFRSSSHSSSLQRKFTLIRIDKCPAHLSLRFSSSLCNNFRLGS